MAEAPNGNFRSRRHTFLPHSSDQHSPTKRISFEGGEVGGSSWWRRRREFRNIVLARWLLKQGQQRCSIEMGFLCVLFRMCPAFRERFLLPESRKRLRPHSSPLLTSLWPPPHGFNPRSQDGKQQLPIVEQRGSSATRRTSTVPKCLRIPTSGWVVLS